MSALFVLIHGAYADQMVYGVFDSLEGALEASHTTLDQFNDHGDTWTIKSNDWRDTFWLIQKCQLNVPEWDHFASEGTQV